MHHLLKPSPAAKRCCDREAVVKALSEQLKKGLKPLVPNKGFRKYLKIEKGSARFDEKQVSYEARSDGKWMLKTNTGSFARKGGSQVQGAGACRKGLSRCQIPAGHPPYISKENEISSHSISDMTV